MKLIQEIMAILSSKDGKLSDALLKTKILLHKIGHKELVEWVNHELNGYPDMKSLPSYRLVPAQVLVNASNIAYRITSHPIPLLHLEKKFRESLQTSKMGQSLAVLEKFVENPEGNLTSPIPMEANGLLGEGLASGYCIERAWCQISKTEVTQILIEVRSRLLDFILELSEQFGGDMTDEEVKHKSNEIDTARLFNNAIFGDNTTIVVGTGNSQVVNNLILKGNFSALSENLLKHGVAEKDIQELETAISDDKNEVDLENKKFGPAVKGWLHKMLNKAVDASWQVELGIASSLLANALQKYYGWP
jgi:hypothetical protein